MLQIKCSKCDSTINSPFLVEVGSVECEHCKANVIVEGVVVTTRFFTIDRDILLRRLRHYRGLLKNIERETGSGSQMSPNPKETQTSKQKYYAALRELLSAARGNYRLPIEENVGLSVEIDNCTSDGSLLNLSTSGAAVRLLRAEKQPRKKASARLIFSLPGATSQLAISTTVAWVGAHKTVRGDVVLGLSFKNVNESIHDHIWDYIVHVHKDSTPLHDDEYPGDAHSQHLQG